MTAAQLKNDCPPQPVFWLREALGWPVVIIQ